LGNSEDNTIVNQNSKRQKLTGIIEGHAIPSLKYLLIHFGIAIILWVSLFICITDWSPIERESFVAISSSLAAVSGTLLAISIALAIFFGRYLLDWRDKLYEELKLAQNELEKQMYKSATKHPEITERLVELFLKAAFYTRGQRINQDEIFKASAVFNDWANEQVKKEKNEKKSFNFKYSNPSTYESLAKHIFDTNLRVTRVREALIELSVNETTGRSIPVFSPLITAWIIIFMISVVAAIIGGIGLGNPWLYFPYLIAIIYITFIAITSLTVVSVNILTVMPRLLESGHEKAMEQLAK
jgi:hypothetical protein